MPVRPATLLPLLGLLLPATVRAEEPPSSPERWGVLLSAGGGLFKGRSDANRGYLLSAHVLATTPVGLELGLVLQRGRTFHTFPIADSPSSEPRARPWGEFNGLGGEARYRFLREQRISPWIALRVGLSSSTKVDTDASEPYRYTNSHLALAGGLGVDVSIQGPFGATLGAYYQSCDINTRPQDNICTGAGPTLVLSPRLRF